VKQHIAGVKPELVVVFEDVGTTGSNSVQVARGALEAGALAVEVVTTWKRQPALGRLDEAGIPYRAIIDEVLPTYSPLECQTDPNGFHARGWDFIPRKK
jgi:orotate phosphoribosyltransferase